MSENDITKALGKEIARRNAYEDGYQACSDGEDRESWPVKLSDDELEAWREGWDDCANGHQCYPPEEEE